MANKSNVVEITPKDTAIGRVINSFSHTLRRMQGLIGGYGVSPDGARNYNQIFGYGDTLSYSQFFGVYKRSAIGRVVVAKVAKGCWNETPKIKSGDTEILEDEMDQLDKMGFFRALERADILNRIGQFSVLLIGVPDGQELSEPVGAGGDIQGMYFNPYNYDGIEIVEWDNDPLSQRFELPVRYQLQTTSHGEKTKDTRRNSVIVHWTRIVHMAENALDSDIEGDSSLESVWNNLINLLKVSGGAAEAYFRNARQQRALEANGDARLEKGSEALETLKENIDAFDNTYDSTLRLSNMTVKHLPIHMITPRDSFDVNIEEISGNTGIPIRILLGKGSGQLAGNEDRATWNGLIADRRASECDTYLMQALRVMERAGTFELPDNAVVEWPAQAALNEKEAADVGKTKAETLNLVMDAMSKIVVNEAVLETVLDTVGLDAIEIDDGDFIEGELDPEPPTIDEG